MTGTLTISAYTRLIDEDIQWLIDNSPKALERDHIELCLAHLKRNKPLWHEIALTPTKGERMPMTEEHFHKVIAMRDELIFEQKDEISKLKIKTNKLQQRLGSIKWGVK